METKLCRICGKLGQNYINIFKIEGLKNKIETCLPIVISPYCLLPDTICGGCLENVDNFYNFIKNCLQNIIILEAQYDIQESCLKTKRKFEKSTTTTTTTDCLLQKFDKNCQTDDLFDVYLRTFHHQHHQYDGSNDDDDDFKLPKLQHFYRLVDYDINSDTQSDDDDNDDNQQQQQNNNLLLKINRRYFDDNENNLIDEITQRKTHHRKRKFDGIIENQQTKIYRMDQINRRKNRQPKKIKLPQIQQQQKIEQFEHYEQQQQDFDLEYLEKIYDLNNISSPITIKQEPITELIPTTTNQQQQQQQELLPQICLLCDEQFSGPSTLASHVFETHGIDMAQILQQQQQINDYNNDKKKKLPNLVKISDLKQRHDTLDDITNDDDGNNREDDDDDDDNRSPPILTANYVCPICPSIFTINRQELFNHLEQIHPIESSLLCGQCLYQANTYDILKQHIEQCKKYNQIQTRYYCKICLYNDDNMIILEKHILIHKFLLDNCRRLMKIFDPLDYIEYNCNFNQYNNNNNNNDNNDRCRSPNTKQLLCNQCGDNNFSSYNDYSQHRRQQHSIFHCDLCTKFYGRNSHLWKHVNRLHKGHPSITCQLCYKTSASKYHLLQHFNKIHNNSKQQQQQQLVEQKDEDFMQQKFQAFDFQSVKQSFMRQELLQEQTTNQQQDEQQQDNDIKDTLLSSQQQQQQQQQDNGEYKCTKCNKCFHKRTLLKKHRKNCRPRLQKDLLTRCKTCSRIFKDRQSLSKHLINYHSKYSCDICGKTVQSKCEIITHIRFQHPQNNLCCKLCKNILRNQYELKLHELNHLNSYVCQFCGDCLDNKIKLKMHILSLHRKILNLSCGICLKLFDNQLKLYEHVKLQHLFNKKQSLTTCPVCGKNYGSKWKTYDHLNKSHGRIFKACKICLEIFDNDTQLQTHYKQIHPNNNQQQQQQQQPSSQKQQTESDNDESDDETTTTTNTNTNTTKVKKQQLQKTTTTTTHNSSKRTVYVNSNDPSYCEICLKQWPAKKHLWQHYIRCHKQVAATVCGICLKTNQNYLELQKHLLKQHPTLLYGQGYGSNFICRICGRYHNASSKLKLHMAIHENFDWNLLNQIDNNNDDDKNDDDDNDDNNTNNVDDKGTKTTNGYGSSSSNNSSSSSSSSSSNNDDDDDNNINYENLIEQVECSSNDNTQTSDDDDNNNNNNNNNNKSDSDDDDDDDDSDTDDSSSDNDESSNDNQSLVYDNNNKSPQQQQQQDENKQNNNEDDLDDDDDDDDINDRDIFNTKTEELNSAIQSIEEQFLIDDDDDDYDDVENDIDDDIDDNNLDLEIDDYCNLDEQQSQQQQQQQPLNDNEIESAVGSIL